MDTEQETKPEADAAWKLAEVTKNYRTCALLRASAGYGLEACTEHRDAMRKAAAEYARFVETYQ